MEQFLFSDLKVANDGNMDASVWRRILGWIFWVDSDFIISSKNLFTVYLTKKVNFFSIVFNFILFRTNIELEFKTLFYKMQGWDTATGYPSRATLESLALGYVADELEKNNRLGQG